MPNLEAFKRQAIQADQDIAILKNNLNRYLKDLKEKFGVDSIDAADPIKLEKYLDQLDKKIKRLKEREEALYSKANLMLEGINHV